MLGDRIVIPKNLQADILQKIHAGQCGIEKCKRHAQQNVFWPGMNRDIETTVKRCKVCIELLPSKLADSLLHHEVRMRPWQKIGSDIFHYGNKNYLIIADCYSLWPEVYLLPSTTSAIVIDT